MAEYGIRITLPKGDPMRAAHLLGDRFEYHRWYPTAAERDRALAEMARKSPYYRRADYPSQVLEKVER